MRLATRSKSHPFRLPEKQITKPRGEMLTSQFDNHGPAGIGAF